MPEPHARGNRSKPRVPVVDARDLAQVAVQADWALVRRAVRDGYVLVTNDTADFTSLMAREPRHPGLICMNAAHGFMRLEVQTKLFEHALTRLADVELAGQVLENTLTSDRTVRVDGFATSE